MAPLSEVITPNGFSRSAKNLEQRGGRRDGPGELGYRADVMRSRVSLYRLAKNSMSRSFTSFGRSCWIQCPAPGTRTFFLKPGIFSFNVESLPIHGDYPVELACYEERGLANLGSAENLRQQFPIPVYVPIPVESASEAGSLELFCVEVQIRFSQPRRERFRTWYPASANAFN
jgi:hypothetical protein